MRLYLARKDGGWKTRKRKLYEGNGRDANASLELGKSRGIFRRRKKREKELKRWEGRTTVRFTREKINERRGKRTVARIKAS